MDLQSAGGQGYMQSATHLLALSNANPRRKEPLTQTGAPHLYFIFIFLSLKEHLVLST